MKLLRRAHIDFLRGSVATIGNFDGVHLGHQALLAKLRAQADSMQLPSVVILFEPQPSEYFRGSDAPARLGSLREKLQVLKSCHIDYVYCLKFNKDLALMAAEDFARHYFFEQLRLRYLLVGEDFRFGRQREGDASLLQQILTPSDCQVEVFSNIDLEGERISSTKIRESLAQGNLARASILLGRPYSLCGRVIKGDGRGRQWGIPTANFSLHRLSLPLKGVFCVEIKKSGQLLKGVANIGTRPTVDGSKNVLEVHLFDFDDNLYGEMLEVVFLSKLRDELKFTSVDALIEQIHKDVKAAKAYFHNQSGLF
ncbi:bifunctional riboflavin kinase/FAD synthetase [Legionella jordanis]|uniref:Riboflavin biosynthesis protein n=1 Tax=Legionella jordanis TaxID=456 RepID=A0A0W0V9V9_9GAMM|nr:bifunctional riboflavin kinase/FAD synthetase [Legionella jordanis]KTD16409.1 riboflavin biosynthesis protein RibF (riboflavin kinase/FMN adenylyltransferase) [Legionella jordanis]RMX04389.1 bifunctional riboflavin kinase/FAD synthetase [Legionella jordanis]RMX15580.1 bifunctional riboflavin kinase/FAD synthetase [Legionella jordanis]VEH12130.1 riboflavin biosynthesis protein RibF (riboflavin kinase/FMN adenylyltransferase) [Legionella jordanis]